MIRLRLVFGLVFAIVVIGVIAVLARTP